MNGNQLYFTDNLYDIVLELQPERVYQKIEGFGGAVTDSVGVNWKSLSPTLQRYLINSYCSEDGLEYNMIRVPNGSTDFSPRPYVYNEYPVNDTKLTNFSSAPEDILYKVPIIQACMKASKSEIKVITSTWAPPNWMLIKDKPSGFSFLNEDFYQTYANYQCKFAELYNQHGIKIWGLSAANEPLMSLQINLKRETMIWPSPKMAKFLEQNLGPTIRNCSVKNIQILGVEDQRYAIPLMFDQLTEYSDAIKYIDGIALHYYGDKTTPPSIVAKTLKNYPDKFVISTEACTAFKATENPKVDLGSWKRGKRYIEDILEVLNYNYIGWIDWNICLNKEGGPTWTKNYVDSPIIVDAENQEFLKQPMFYAMGHFSKFIPRGSKRIRVVKKVPEIDPDLDLQDIEALGQKYFDHVAFLTPQRTIVIVFHNEGPTKSAAIQLGAQQISIELDAESISTIEIPYDDQIN
ncbi:unnamed protein product [Euphydryas editha]|uniref:Glucosylceramidase n=1 Tax=Euphydryas editha TaxID=104508 RepID=A0AAU9U7M1_EUPED|nr:unnamed protein product [Euphydryas editha]